MRLRPVLIAAALLVGALALGLGLGVLTGAPPAAPSEARPPVRSAAPGTAGSARPVRPPVSRDMLRYQQDERPAPPPQVRREPLGPIVTIPVAPPPPAERLVGFVRRGGELQAALALPGAGTVVLGAGQAVDGYVLISVDEEAGVVLRLPDGRELALRPPVS